ncbi:MAG TPA: TetR/AcrR family transcriptional regulator [Ktedonobacterales bacterium]|jgi:AcrR family transcriptional regulator|nr:TetR/AcrR family transcriptional regulator [Ktedonobacterales bacterium]
MATQINLGDPRVKRTRQLLQEAFISLMMEGRFRDITVQQIADRATVNRATFYAHFEDKFDLLDSAIRERFKQELAARMPNASVWSKDHLRLLVTIIFECVAMTNHECKPSDRDFAPYRERAIQEETEAILLGWMRQPNFPGSPEGVTTQTLAMVWSWAIFGAATQWSRSERRAEPEELARQVTLTLLRTVSAL